MAASGLRLLHRLPIRPEVCCPIRLLCQGLVGSMGSAHGALLGFCILATPRSLERQGMHCMHAFNIRRLELNKTECRCTAP